jgi:hypothetical protein
MSKVMKPSNCNSASTCIAFILLPIVVCIISCSENEFARRPAGLPQGFISGFYNHFEGGVLFTDVAFGLDVLWEASFQNGKAYKENLGFFVPGGLVISPNKNNSLDRARMNAFYLKVVDGKLYITVEDQELQVLGIIHTHPNAQSLRMPTPRSDFQYAFMGIHNYVMGHRDLFDAYKIANGAECYKRLGPRLAYDKLPFNDLKASIAANAEAHGLE